MKKFLDKQKKYDIMLIMIENIRKREIYVAPYFSKNEKCKDDFFINYEFVKTTVFAQFAEEWAKQNNRYIPPRNTDLWNKMYKDYYYTKWFMKRSKENA